MNLLIVKIKRYAHEKERGSFVSFYQSIFCLLVLCLSHCMSSVYNEGVGYFQGDHEEDQNHKDALGHALTNWKALQHIVHSFYLCTSIQHAVESDSDAALCGWMYFVSQQNHIFPSL